MNADIRNAAESPRAIRVPAGAVTLDGEIQVPPAPVGLVLLAHCGGDPAVSPHLSFATHLRQAKLGTVSLDLLTPEEQVADAARGHLRHNIGLLTQRLVSAAHWVGGEDEARHQRLGFLASGTTGAAVLVAAADLGRSIGAVALVSGRPDLAGGALRRVRCPVLLLLESADGELPDFNAEALELLNCPKELQTLRGDAKALAPAAQQVGQWFLDHLGHANPTRFRC